LSSTARGYERHVSDYYVTPVNKIVEFLDEFLKYEPNVLDGEILDPCAGGLLGVDGMSYPKALEKYGIHNVKTIDVREDSLAETYGNYLEMKLDYKPNLIISNPPFIIAREFIEKALDDVADDGFVIMLQRLNFFGGKKRKDFWDNLMPKYTFVHSRRMSFTHDGKTDSIEYAHYVWQKGYSSQFTQLKVIG
jgi:hypothetical protein